MTAEWTKTYPTAPAAALAAAHHAWIRRTGNLHVPELLDIAGDRIVFAYVPGRHVERPDLVRVARVQAGFDAAAHHHLGAAATGRTHRARCGLMIRSFAHRRRPRLLRLLDASPSPDTWLTVQRADKWMSHAAGLPASVYKDANVRNFLLTDDDVVAVDFDTLTLAPFGYDLAKLVVSAAMTYGPFPDPLVGCVLAAYNAVLAAHRLPACTAEEFEAWTEMHHVLTSPYQGSNGYQHSWRASRLH